MRTSGRERSLTSNGHSDGVVFRMDGDGDWRRATHAIRSDERVLLGGITATTGGDAVFVGGLRDAATIGSRTGGAELEAQSVSPAPLTRVEVRHGRRGAAGVKPSARPVVVAARCPG